MQVVGLRLAATPVPYLGANRIRDGVAAVGVYRGCDPLLRGPRLFVGAHTLGDGGVG